MTPTRMADRVLQAPELAETRLACGVRQAQRFIIDNVAEYLDTDDAKGSYQRKDFPNVAPPFGCCWFEYRATIPQRRQMQPGDPMPEDVGALMIAAQWEDFLELLAAIPDGHLLSHRYDRPGRWGWRITGYVHAYHPILQERGMLDVGDLVFAVDHDGTIMPFSGSEGWLAYLLHARVTDKKQSIRGLTDVLTPMMLALSFLHCKNVTLTDPVREVKHDRAARRRGDPIGTTYRRLIIEPMRQILDQHRGGGPGDLQQALHICRGHFKDYRDGGGLFGRQHGLFWWESQVRGSATRGRVVKEYDVRPPKETTHG